MALSAMIIYGACDAAWGKPVAELTPSDAVLFAKVRRKSSLGAYDLD